MLQALIGSLNSPEILEKLASLLGESTAATKKGVAAAIPAVFGGLLAKGMTEAGAGSLLGMMREHKVDGALDQLGSMFSGASGALDDGSRMLKSVFGNSVDAVAKLVGLVSGMSNERAGKLMSLVAPAVLGGVAKEAPAGGFSAAGLTTLLTDQRENLAKLAPPGLGSLLGLGGLGGGLSPAIAGRSSSSTVAASVAAGSSLQNAAAAAVPIAAAARGGARALWPWAVFAGVLCLALLLGSKACSTPQAEQPASEEPVATDPVEPEAVAPAEPAPAEITLPSGTVLTVPPGSVGENLFNFLSGSETGSKTFLFDGLTFETGSATLDADSQATIAAIAEILKEFGAATVSVDGYTDNTGSRQDNMNLSQARAQEVLSALAAAGVDAARMSATGHADDSPVADNSTEEGRAQNRRTELTATKN